MNNLYTKFLCAFVGWDYKLLNECSPASKKTLHRYAGAIILLMFLWFYIGYGMADRYFVLESTWSKLGVAFAFSFIIWIIERQIILIVGKNKIMGLLRGALAIIMAILGATIIDQKVFEKDINAQRAKIVEQRTDERLVFERRIIADEFARNQKELDSLEIKASAISQEVTKRPMIKSTTYHRTAAGVDSLGNAVMATGYNEQNIPNPKFKDLERVNIRIDNIRNNLSSLVNKEQELRDDIKRDVMANIGLLTELEITFSKDVIGSSIWTIIFYIGVFCFFLLIELLVVSGKVCSEPCDYENLVEQQQARKIEQIKSILPLSSDNK